MQDAILFYNGCLIQILEQEENNRMMQKVNFVQEKQDQNKLNMSVKTKTEKINYALYYLDTNKTHLKGHTNIENTKYIKNNNFVNRSQENGKQCSMYNSMQKKNRRFKNMRFIIQKINEMSKNSTNLCLAKSKWPCRNMQSKRWRQIEKDLDHGKQETKDGFSDNKCSNSPYLINKFVLSKRLMVTSLILSQHHNRDQAKYHKNDQLNVRLRKGEGLKCSKITTTEKQLHQIEQIYYQKKKIYRYFQNNLSSNLYSYQLSQTQGKSYKNIDNDFKDSFPSRPLKERTKLKSSQNSDINYMTKSYQMKTAESSPKREKK